MLLNVNLVRKALKQRQFVPYLQPVHNIETGECVGAEILARLPCIVSGELLPTAFMPHLSSMEALSELTDILLEKVGDWLADCTLPQGFWLMFNITADMAGETKLQEACRRLRVNSGGRVIPVVELTEQHPFTCDDPDWHSQLTNLKNDGVLVALDDFGIGYSSLQLLQQTGAGILKLPREFIGILSDSNISIRIIDAMVYLAQNLGLRIIAEGVEKKEQRDFLSQKGITLVQGFYYSKPLTIKGFSQYMKAFSKL